MTEMNIRIIEPGPALKLEVRVCELIAQDPDAKAFERACNALRGQGLAAVKSGQEILLLATRLAQPVAVKDEEWRAEIRDAGRSRTLIFSHPDDARLLAQLLERRLLIEITRCKRWWKLDSPRIWYEPTPKEERKGIAAYRRYEVSSLVIEGVGVGLTVDVGTGFFTTESVADFFREDLPKERREQNRIRFDRLSQRQRGQKATLLYDCKKSQHKCYFEKVNPGETCASTGELVVRHKVFGSLFDYCEQEQPQLGVKANDPVARVSFFNVERPVPVASKYLFLRVMNNALPQGLDELDKIAPADRRWLVEGFWTALGNLPLGVGMPVLRGGFWRPPSNQCQWPGLLFGQQALLSPSSNGDFVAKKDFFRNRSRLLREKGCFHVPPTAPRQIHLAVPKTVSEDAASELADSISKALSKWTRQQTTVLDPQWYSDLGESIETLKREAQPGIALLVFENQDPADYYTVSNELKSWRVKRITVDQLESCYRSYARVKNTKWPEGKPPREVRDWRSFIEMCALDVLQQMGCVLWRPANGLNYEAHLGIDVGHDRRFYAVSLLICRRLDTKPHTWLDSSIEVKADPQRETINEHHLKASILKLFKKAQRMRFDPLDSLLVLRDGRECGQELEGIMAAKDELVRWGMLKPGARLDVVDFHKESLKGVRLWDSTNGHADNVIEGTYVLLNNREAVLANTGLVTLSQGTSVLLMLSARSEGTEMRRVAEDVHVGSHFNWSSPRMAQRLPIVLKRTDEQLENRTDQEIKRIR